MLFMLVNAITAQVIANAILLGQGNAMKAILTTGSALGLTGALLATAPASAAEILPLVAGGGGPSKINNGGDGVLGASGDPGSSAHGGAGGTNGSGGAGTSGVFDGAGAGG
jgi:hypothetical protein